MKCPSYKIFFGLLSCLFFSFFFSFSNTYAVEDLNFSFDSSTSTSPAIDICDDSGNNPCSSYKYIYSYCDDYSSFNFSNPRANIRIYFATGNFTSALYPHLNSYLTNLSSFTRVSFYSKDTFPSSTTCHIVLTENNPFSGITPSGSLSITENGTYDVTNYAEAVVNVPQSSGGGGGDYHDDLVAINNSILICAATCLVLYFFYCIYRMIIKSTGGF